jgi:hypothetical protein
LLKEAHLLRRQLYLSANGPFYLGMMSPVGCGQPMQVHALGLQESKLELLYELQGIVHLLIQLLWGERIEPLQGLENGLAKLETRQYYSPGEDLIH